MSGMQTMFGLTSSPVELWRGETEWLMNRLTRVTDAMGNWADVIYTTPIFLSSNP